MQHVRYRPRTIALTSVLYGIILAAQEELAVAQLASPLAFFFITCEPFLSPLHL
jgi:hypothetical protein